MRLLPSGTRVFVTPTPVDLRGGHDRLAALVRASCGEALFTGDLFVFLGRRMDRCKILFWERGGLVLYYKRLEQGRFQAPQLAADAKTIEMDMTALAMLLDGIDVKGVRRPTLWTPKLAKRTEGIDTTIRV